MTRSQPPPELAEHWARFHGQGCQESRDWLIERSRPLVALTVKRLLPKMPVAIDPEDLHSVGYIAVIRAVDRFDPGRQVQFTSFAIALIRGALLEHLRAEDWAPRQVREKQKRLLAAERALLEAGREATAMELAAYLEMGTDEFQQFTAAAQVWQVVSWDDVVADREWDNLDPLYRRDGFADPAPGPEERAIKSEETAQVEAAMGCLPRAERNVIRRYYWQGETLKVIAKGIRRSESRSHQVHAAGLKRLREEYREAVAA